AHRTKPSKMGKFGQLQESLDKFVLLVIGLLDSLAGFEPSPSLSSRLPLLAVLPGLTIASRQKTV
ncbi:MAG TPA: hypothetical protein VKR81_07340, partial [Candidatus Binatia bacterium]|nr:hypothetical protein [Candidatus Binatia bacterium]